MEKITWSELVQKFRNFNNANGYTTKGNEKYLTARVVITEDSFSKPYTEEQRTYQFTSDNKAFISGMSSNSIFADCIDGTDSGVRLDCYIYDTWKVEYAYIVDEMKW